MVTCAWRNCTSDVEMWFWWGDELGGFCQDHLRIIEQAVGPHFGWYPSVDAEDEDE